MSGERAVAVAWSGRQRAAASNTERTQIHPDCDRLLLQVGGSCADAFVPPSRCGEEHRGRHRPLWIPSENPLKTASRHSAQSECTADTIQLLYLLTYCNYHFLTNRFHINIQVVI